MRDEETTIGGDAEVGGMIDDRQSDRCAEEVEKRRGERGGEGGWKGVQKKAAEGNNILHHQPSPACCGPARRTGEWQMAGVANSWAGRIFTKSLRFRPAYS